MADDDDGAGEFLGFDVVGDDFVDAPESIARSARRASRSRRPRCGRCCASPIALAAGNPAAARVRARMHRETVRRIGGILRDILHHLMRRSIKKLEPSPLPLSLVPGRGVYIFGGATR